MTFEPYPDLDVKTSTFQIQDFMTHYQWVATFPGGQATARRHVNWMAKNWPSLFAELPEMWEAAMRSKGPSEPTATLGNLAATGR